MNLVHHQEPYALRRANNIARYYVALEVVYPVEVEADSEEEAIEQELQMCPYDNDGEPAVDLIEDKESET